jgi:hypothetical protein
VLVRTRERSCRVLSCSPRELEVELVREVSECAEIPFQRIVETVEQ